MSTIFKGINLFEYAKQCKPIQTQCQVKRQKIFIEKSTKIHNGKYDYYIPEWEMNQAKWKSARKYCEKMGYDFQIWTEKELGI